MASLRCLILLAFCSGCGAEPCTLWGEKRCGGGNSIETCTYVNSSEGGDAELGWQELECRAGTVCVERERGEALCALAAWKDPRCTGKIAMACDGTSVVVCDEGHATEVQTCNACIAEAACDDQLEVGKYDPKCCPGGWGSHCTGDSDCVAGLACKVEQCL